MREERLVSVVESEDCDPEIDVVPFPVVFPLELLLLLPELFVESRKFCELIELSVLVNVREVELPCCRPDPLSKLVELKLVLPLLTDILPELEPELLELLDPELEEPVEYRLFPDVTNSDEEDEPPPFD